MEPKNTSYIRAGGETAKKLKCAAPRPEDAKDTQTNEELTAQLFEDLQGSWFGNSGQNLIAVPAPDSTPDGLPRFSLLTQNYSERLTFTSAGAPARNRGGDIDQFISALTYEQVIADINSNEALHIENGMYMNLSKIVKESDGTPEPIPTFNIARSGTIPHGDSIMMIGGPPTHSEGVPEVPDADAKPPNFTGPLGYLDVYLETDSFSNPNLILQRKLEEMKNNKITVLEYTTFTLDSNNNGGINNTPFIVQRANATRAAVTFWLMKVKNETTGTEFDQLMYSQDIDIEFHNIPNKEPPELIIWPHYSVNVLVKQ